MQEAASALADAGGGAALYAGGTELLLAMKSGLLAYDTLINVKSIPGLDVVSADGDSVVIGASATHTAMSSTTRSCASVCRLLAEVEHGVANLRVRNVGTLAGNLCFAEPHSDPATLLLVYEAELDVAGPSGSRRIAVGELQTGSYETSLDTGRVADRRARPRIPRWVCAPPTPSSATTTARRSASPLRSRCRTASSPTHASRWVASRRSRNGCRARRTCCAVSALTALTEGASVAARGVPPGVGGR